MKKITLPVVALLMAMTASSQNRTYTFTSPELIPVKLERMSKAVRDVPEAVLDAKGTMVEHENESIEKHPPVVNQHALPNGADEALQSSYAGMDSRSPSTVTVNVLTTLQGLTANVSPSDNNIAVGPNHVVQMANASTSTNLRIWNKAGTLLVTKTVQSFSGINDYGDPNILYDQAADRYVFVVLYSRNQKKLEVCVSKTADPTGNWWVYTFSTPGGFPDYPKLGVWGNSYIITTNSNSPTIYCLNRTAMLAGTAMGTAQMFTMSKFPQIGFQAASPVSQTGPTPPPAGVPASVIRVADDAWSSSLSPDHLEMFNLNINWTTPSASTITGPVNLNTIAYNSNLCGYGSAACIPQPGTTTKLDPLSDIIMDKVQYRNFGTYESMVCSHVCNADGNGTAGIRWYELRRNQTTGAWYIYQQSTYSPNTTHRWMSSISMNDRGTIALGYNASSSSVYPGIRLTGRDSCDAINSMTVAETITTPGTASNSSSRYGDYNGMVADPSDGSFWFTAQYNSSSIWSTKLVHFTFSDCPAPRLDNEPAGVASAISNLQVIPNPAADEVTVSFVNSGNATAALQVFDMTGKMVMEQTAGSKAGMSSTVLNVRPLAAGCYLVKVSSEKDVAVKRLMIQK